MTKWARSNVPQTPRSLVRVIQHQEKEMDPLPIHIERSAPLPIGTQLEAQLKHLIASGALPGGTRLPTVRDLGASLGINRNTVQAVYRSLKRGGMLEAKRRQGTHVVAEAPRTQPHQHRRLRELLQEILDLEFTPAELVALVQTEAGRLALERARQAEGLAASRYRFATWGRYPRRGDISEQS